ncbi:Trehalose import ATP-binding protein SugC [Baekduia alba]|uniref:ABC transporter ATP-binding protein n=1 Tax=Baekduia alba TaxID=2997333 RepID=UPI0023424804|nr:sn-glycerol-3-phosphate ABC transporter ATP-binding protein UgpC [Baekduia alba]WCB91886.1 Trehalose import ATP-binding protein SugC [Baekduia alba]
MASIGFAGVTKTFDDGTTAVEALDLEIRDGEFMVLVGPSGSGKSTALRMLAGLEESTGGSIRIGDRVVDDMEPKDRDLAMVFQSYALYPHMTVAENMGFALKMQGAPKREIGRRVADAAEKLGITGLLERRPKQLSGGQRQRVALGRAIVRDPAAFLMDEPLSNLDAKLRVEMRAYLARLHQDLGTTTVYVTHDQTEAMTMGDRVAVMRDGRLAQCGPPEELYDAPADLFVAGFMGSPAMNLVRARIVGDDVVIGSQRLRLTDAVRVRRPGLRAYDGREVVVGIRPESVAQSPNGPVAGRTLELDVVLTEALGSDLLVHADIDAPVVLTADQEELAEEVVPAALSRMTLRLPPGAPVRAGERVRALIDVERLHFFDPDAEHAIR